MFKGAITALITPFHNGEIDWKAFDNLVEWQVEQGIHGLVACGTTAESPCLEPDEHILILERCVDIVKGRVPVIAGTGFNSTAKTITMTGKAKDLGADAAMIVTPYYNKPSQQGLYEHYKAVDENIAFPVIVYNIPGRCIVDITLETLEKISSLPHVAGIKDATGDLSRPPLIKKIAGDNFCQLSGEDATTYEYLVQGGHGSVSVTSNIAPALCVEMQESYESGNKERARQINAQLADLHNSLFMNPSPSPAKYAAFRLGLCRNEMRLPLVPADAACEKAVEDAMVKAGLLQTGQYEAQKIYG